MSFDWWMGLLGGVGSRFWPGGRWTAAVAGRDDHGRKATIGAPDHASDSCRVEGL